MEDNQIIALYFSRDEDAIAETKSKYGAHLRNLSENILKDRGEAEECENDTYLRAWNSIPPTRPLNFFAWLLRVARNLSLNRLEVKKRVKHNAVLVELSEELADCLTDPNGTVETAAEGREVERLIDGWLDWQDEMKRFIFLRRYFYGDELSEIARYTGKTQAAVRQILCRMRGELRELLNEKGVTV